MFLLVLSGFLFFEQVFQAEAAQCGYRTTDLKGTIKSPYQQGNAIQRGEFNCFWTISVPEGYNVKLVATSFSLHGQTGNCQYDWVLFESNMNHGKYCGTSNPPRIVSVGNELRIHYSYRYSGSYSYFTFSYDAVPAPSVYNVTKYWIGNNTEKFFDPKENINRAISALFLFNETYFVQGNGTAMNLTTQFRLQLAADLLRNNTFPLSAAALSQHVTALLAICRNPRSVFGIDLVYHLRRLVNKKTGLANPYYYLTLCNAGDKITSTDVEMLRAIIEGHRQDMFWLDFQAMALMTLVCAAEQGSGHDVEKEIMRGLSALKKRQLEDGSFGSLQTTSLVVQALTAANSIDYGWNRKSAVKFIESANSTDGSFGSLYNLYAAVPVISGKTLLYINASRCDFTSDGLTPLEEVKDKLAEPIDVLYSIWIGDNVDYSYTISIKVPRGTKFLDFMRLASTTDAKFRFQWKYVKDVLYVYEINGLVNDPSSGRYWTFFTGEDITRLRPHYKGLEHYVPDDGDMAVMWYRTISLEHHWQQVDRK